MEVGWGFAAVGGVCTLAERKPLPTPSDCTEFQMELQRNSPLSGPDNFLGGPVGGGDLPWDCLS